jgi:hypothetical protein
MRATDGYQLSNVGTGTYGPFYLNGGVYAWTTKSTGSGTIDLKIQAFDGSTYIAVATQVTATTGFQTSMYLPPGQYEIVIATFTANYIAVTRVPLE